MRSGQTIPDRIANAPEIPDFMRWYFDAFFDLSSHRQVGFSEGPIPYMAIVQYGQFYGCDEQELEDLVYYIRSMDTAYLEFAENKRKREKSKK